MDWKQTSHCSWDRGSDQQIVKATCQRLGGTVFKLFDGAKVTYHRTLNEAKLVAEEAHV